MFGLPYTSEVEIVVVEVAALPQAVKVEIVPQETADRIFVFATTRWSMLQRTKLIQTMVILLNSILLATRSATLLLKNLQLSLLLAVFFLRHPRTNTIRFLQSSAPWETPTTPSTVAHLNLLFSPPTL